ncbi:MAG: DUF1579 domain-containing protein [Fimbriimonadaceae bacterium]
MSTETHEMEMGTKPVAEHEWLQNLVGEWKVESVMQMGPDQEPCHATGHESVTSLGGLWAFVQGTGEMPGGAQMRYFATLGFDVSFREYRGCWFADMSSHLWKQVGTLSADGKTMTLDCEGPDMEEDGKTANYRDVIHLVDKDHRTLTSSGQDKDGNWQEFMRATLTRV